MPFLVLTRPGWNDLLENAESLSDAVWASPGVLTPREINDFRRQGVSLTIFTRPISHDDEESIIQAMDEIENHHPGQSIWVEFPTSD